MKKVYWRPKAVSRTALMLIAGLALVGLILVETLLVQNERPHQREKLEAANLARVAIDSIYFAREEVGPAVDPETDPTISGMIGLAMSPVTSVSGQLVAKQTSVNPNFAAVMVELFKRAEVKEGDVVAIGVSGSFPALNVATYAAIETLKLKPIVIASAAASQFGANVPNLLWIDMERILDENDIFTTRSVASSIGGYEDRGMGLSDEGLVMIRESIERNGLQMLEAATFEDAVEERMQLYKKFAKGKPIKAYVNIGGGTISVGRSTGKRLFHPGLNRRAPDKVRQIDGIMPRFIQEGTPVIHLIQVSEMAERYGLPIAPATMPEVGQAAIFAGPDYNKWLTALVLLAEVGLLYTFIRSDIGFRLLRRSPRRAKEATPEPMV